MRIQRRVWVRELLCRRVAREPVGQQRGVDRDAQRIAALDIPQAQQSPAAVSHLEMDREPSEAPTLLGALGSSIQLGLHGPARRGQSGNVPSPERHITSTRAPRVRAWLGETPIA